MRRRLSYANVAATLALVFSMSGGALAAKHYLIESTRQINPKVLKKLKGSRGAAGLAGLAGVPGAPGKEGAPGARGETGPSHAYHGESAGVPTSVSVPAGIYVVSGHGQFFAAGKAAGLGECTLEAGGAPVQTHFATVPNTGIPEEKGSSGEAIVANETAVTMKAPGKITENCKQAKESADTVSSVGVVVDAILVGGLN
jgi:hypothetical protein